MIINYIKNTSSVTAASLITQIYGSADTSKALYPDQIIQVANSYGLSPIFTSSRISAVTVQAQINLSKPLYIDMLKSDAVSRHAFCLTGYSISGATYTIWNPWKSYFETLPTSNHIYVDDDGHTWIWARTIYAW